MYRDLFSLFAILCLLSTSTHATGLVRLEVQQHADIYEISVEMLVSAPAERVRAILTDYANLDRLNDSITSSRVIGAGTDGSVRVQTRIQNCILFFCMNMQKVEDVTQDAQGRILVSIVPDSSSFRSGHASWELQGAGNSTRVIHHASLEPSLWIPPWIGTAILEDSLRREVQKSFATLDCLARQQCPLQHDLAGSDSKATFLGL